MLDLPGTNDRQAQDHLAKAQLLRADWVIHLLDGRKLITLSEREYLRDGLQERGLSRVIFVVNFLNLLAPEDQKQVFNRMRSVAESFRSHLPPGMSNLYRVDALPALRARLKGDMAAAQSAGLPLLESALQRMVADAGDVRLTRLTPRLMGVAHQLQSLLKDKIAQITIQAEVVRAIAANNKWRFSDAPRPYSLKAGKRVCKLSALG